MKLPLFFFQVTLSMLELTNVNKLFFFFFYPLRRTRHRFDSHWYLVIGSSYHGLSD